MRAVVDEEEGGRSAVAAHELAHGEGGRFASERADERRRKGPESIGAIWDGQRRGLGRHEDGALARRVESQQLVAAAEAQCWAADSIKERDGFCRRGEVDGPKRMKMTIDNTSTVLLT